MLLRCIRMIKQWRAELQRQQLCVEFQLQTDRQSDKWTDKEKNHNHAKDKMREEIKRQTYRLTERGRGWSSLTPTARRKTTRFPTRSRQRAWVDCSDCFVCPPHCKTWSNLRLEGSGTRMAMFVCC